VPFPHMVLRDEATGEVTFKRGAFKWDKDGCSCHRHVVLHANGLSWVDVKKRHENGVLRVQVADLRNNGLGIAADPSPDVDDPHPADVAHALIVVGPVGLSNSKREQAFSKIARRAVLMPSE
jgi:hypothetical protein